MYSYSQLLLRNVGLSILFYISITGVFTLFFIENLNNKQSFEKKSIQYLAEQSLAEQSLVTINSNNSNESSNNIIDNTETTAKQLAKTLNNLFAFHTLNISILSGKKLFSQQGKNQYPYFDFMMPKPVNLILKKQNVRIHFQLSFAKDLNLFQQLLMIFALSTVIFCFIVTTLGNKHHKSLYREMGEQIKKQFSLILKNKKITSNGTYDYLKEGISEIKAMIESQQQTSLLLEEKAFTDNITGLNNRNKFVHFFENSVAKDGDAKFGVLLITRCSELQTINKIRGFNDGDRYLSKVAKIMQSSIMQFNGGQIFRMNSCDFATVLPNRQLPDGEKYAQLLTDKFNSYQQAAELDSIAYTGLVAFNWQSPLGELLALVDTGISIAQTQNINSWFSQKDINALKDPSATYGHQNWRQEIDHVIENKRISLLVQPIQPNSRNSRVYGEVLARFLNSNDEMLPTASFIAMAEKLDKIVDIDRLIIEKAIEEIKSKNLLDKSFGLNISARSINDEHFLIWLERRLLKEHQVASRLVFEITEYGLQQNIKSSKRFIDLLHRSGARITVERFGVSLTSFKFFRELKPDFIKMDSTYTRDIDEDKNNQYFIRLMVDLAHRLSINVLAESVETIEEKHTLEKLFIDGCQGYYIDKPMSL